MLLSRWHPKRDVRNNNCTVRLHDVPRREDTAKYVKDEVEYEEYSVRRVNVLLEKPFPTSDACLDQMTEKLRRKCPQMTEELCRIRPQKPCQNHYATYRQDTVFVMDATDH